MQASSRSIRCTASLTLGGDDGEGYVGELTFLENMLS